MSEWEFGSRNEWGKLHKIIIGRVDNARFPSWDLILRNTIPPESVCEYEAIFSMKGELIPQSIIDKANLELEGLVDVLECRGISVIRPDVTDFDREYSTPDWHVHSGISSANPRDVFLVAGKVIIECPMADRGRYFEAFPYRNLMMDLSDEGFSWIAAPKPILSDRTYTKSEQYTVSNNEPLFDAADFIRCGDVIIGQLSHVTNNKGVKWLRSILKPDFEIKLITSKCSAALHIDTTLIPLSSNVILINSEFVDPNEVKKLLPGWKILIGPKPNSFYTDIGGYRIVSDWMSMNVLSLDENTVIVEKKQSSLINLLESNNFEVIPLPFENYYIFGGSFHCCSLDVVREE